MQNGFRLLVHLVKVCRLNNKQICLQTIAKITEVCRNTK